MNKKPYNSADVCIFHEILKAKEYIDNEDNTQKNILNTIQNIHKKEVIFSGLDINRQKLLRNINFCQYGYRSGKDIKIEFIQNIFDNNTKMILTPNSIYELEDIIDLPNPINNQSKLFQDLLSDTYERLKVKAISIIQETEEHCFIQLYVNKNIQLLHRIFYDSRIELHKVQLIGTQTSIFNVLSLNIYIINVIIYLQNMFSNFYQEELLSKDNLKLQLCNTLDLNKLINPVIANKKASIKIRTNNKITLLKWNGQINTLITLVYDLMNFRHGNDKMLLEATTEDIKYLLNKYVVDKNSKPISKQTIETCLKEYRDEKRAKGSKRIDVSKIVNGEKM